MLYVYLSSRFVFYEVLQSILIVGKEATDFLIGLKLYMLTVTRFFNNYCLVNKSLFLNKGFQFFLDILFLSASFVISYMIRFEFNLDEGQQRLCLIQLLFVVPIQFVIFRSMGIYKQIWKYISIPEATNIGTALLVSSAIFLSARIMLFSLNWIAIPISIIIADLCIASICIISLRTFRRMIYEEFEKKQTSNQILKKKPVFLIGAGRAGIKTLSEIKSRGDIDIDVRGFIDDDLMKKGAVINGVKVLGTVDDLSHLIKSQQIDHVIISISQTSRQNIKRIVNICEKITIRVRTIPGLYELLQDKVTISRIRDIQIEDLLGRPEIELDKENIETFIKNKTVMVTGAGGSIGSELVRQILRCTPQQIILIERSELALFNIEREISESFPNIKYHPFIADICNEPQMSKIFRESLPQVVFHTAAHKHVPLMERNVAEAVKNNIQGTQTIARCAGLFSAEAFVLISTDKAVNPTSIMGATKRVAELVIQNLNQVYETRYSAVRFGNVIGSTGSVIPIFQEQIKKGGPITVTHPEMQRYFMTIPEATQLVLQAGAIGQGGEIFILDMGEQVKIVDLAKDAIILSGLKPDVDIEIVFKGMRPGEKLFEELQINTEELVKTFHPKIFIGKIYPYSSAVIWEALENLSVFCLEDNEQEIRRYLNKLIPEARLQEKSDAKLNVVVNAQSNVALNSNFGLGYPSLK